MRFPSRLFVILLVAVFLQGFPGNPSAQAGAASPKADPVQLLRKNLDGIFSDSRFAQASMGIKVLSLDRAEILYEKNAQRLLIPASSNKIITAAVALTRLGAGYRFETRILTEGQVEDGILKGNLIIAGSGDPTFSPRFSDGDPFATLRMWAANLREKNIRAISGSILGTEGTFGESALGQGWEWNDLSHAYAAPVGALQFNDNTMTLAIAPGTGPGAPASVHASPLDGYLKINNRAVTGPEGSLEDIRIRNGESNETIDVLGTIPAKGAVVQQPVAVRSPVLYFLSALRHVLYNEGIVVENVGLSGKPYESGGASQLWIHTSAELAEIIKPLLKNSLNLYAETLVRTLGLIFRGEGTFAKGKEIVEESLAQMEIGPGTYSYADGSGLSRLNLESADSFVRLLKFMSQEKNFQSFYDALPVAGVDGTLASRMKRTRAADNVHAKTGSMANVSSISGYVKTVDGETLAFSITVNGYVGPRDVVESMEDKALVRLAGFSRETRSQKPGAGSQKKAMQQFANMPE